jgi:hypothetical protein
MNRPVSRSLVLSFLAVVGGLGMTLLAQPPAGAPPAGGPGGGGGAARGGGAPAAPAAPTNAPASAGQITALARFNTENAALVTAVNNARAAIASASLALPANPADVQARVDALAQAEFALATARASWIAGLQSGADKFNAAQLAVLKNSAATAGGGRGGFSQSEPLNYSDMTGFVKIFDGRTLAGWVGDDQWFVDDESISTKGGRGTTYIIFAKQKFKNFEMKLEFKIVDGANTGIQYRSRLSGGGRSGRGGHDPDNPAAYNAVMGQARGGPPATQAMAAAQPAATPPPAAAGPGGGFGGRGGANPYDIGGYQFDIGGRNQGQLYEQDGRGIVVYPGEVGILEPGLTGPRHYIVGKLPGTPIQDNPGEWNHIHLIANGSTLVHITNDQLSTVSVDNDPAYATREGFIALQIEGGGQLWFKNIYVKELP